MASSQSHRRAVAKRQIMGAWMDVNGESKTSSSPQEDDGEPIVDAEHVQLLVEDLQTKLDQHIELLKTDLFTAKTEQHQSHSSGMMKLSKSVRQMTIREFNQTHSCNLLSLLKGNDGVQREGGGVVTSISDDAAASFKKRDRMAVAETPAPTRRNPAEDPGSALRTVRRGEAI
jgi:hypothetical protein